MPNEKVRSLAITQALNGMNPDQARATLARIDVQDEQGRNTPFASAILSRM
jgi:hypothetical protein